MKRVDLIKKGHGIEPGGGKISVSDLLEKFDALARIDRQDDVERATRKEELRKEIRAALVSLIET